MFELTFLDNYRYGIFHHEGRRIRTPALVNVRGDSLFLEDLSIERPSWILPNDSGTHLKTAPLLRIPYHIPRSIAGRMMEENVRILKESAFDCLPLSITEHSHLNEEMHKNIYEASIFFFTRCEERAFVQSITTLRRHFPSTLFYTHCAPHEIPIYLMLGFDLFNHTQENQEALQAFKAHPTKQYVEKESNASIHTKRLLRLMYESHAPIELFTKNKAEKEIYISHDSLMRPEVERFRRTVAERYVPSTDIFVLLPCSAHKPYSSSPSHVKFISALKKGAGKHYPALTQLILTSPLGVIPRELEELVDYDTVVTGFWSHEEISCARRILSIILGKSKNPLIIAHLPEEYKRICEELGEIEYTCNGRATTQESLERLSAAVGGVPFPIEERRDIDKDKIRKISHFIFDEDIFPSHFSIKGKWTKRIVADGKVLATWSKTLYPTLEGATRMKKYWVDIDFDLRGDIFCAGVLDADERIRAGDMVCIRKDGEPCGVGRALLPAFLMKKMKHGKAVLVKHKK
jgi:predicted RNA-binding protein (TIGR00451 family)